MHELRKVFFFSLQAFTLTHISPILQLLVEIAPKSPQHDNINFYKSMNDYTCLFAALLNKYNFINLYFNLKKYQQMK